MGSPITSWDGAEAYFSFASSPGLMALFLVASAVITFGTILVAGHHESECYKKIKK
jgi:hypothetical protein